MLKKNDIGKQEQATLVPLKSPTSRTLAAAAFHSCDSSGTTSIWPSINCLHTRTQCKVEGKRPVIKGYVAR